MITLTEEDVMVILLFSVPHTLFSLCLLFEFTLLGIRSISTDCCSSDFALANLCGLCCWLDVSAPRSCGCVGEPFFPLHFHSPGVVGRPSSCLGLSARRLCGRVGWPFAPPHLLSSVVMALALVAPFRCGVVVVCKLGQSCAPRVKMVGARQEDGFPSAPSLCPAERRTLSFRRVSWLLLSVFPVQAPLLSATVAAVGAPSR